MPVWLHQSLTNYIKGFPCGDFLSKRQKLVLGMGLSQAKTKKAAEDAAAEEEGECLAAEANGEGGKSDEGTSAVNVESNMDAEAAEAIEDGSF